MKKEKLLILILIILVFITSCATTVTVRTDSIHWTFYKYLVDDSTGEVIDEVVLYGGYNDPVPEKHPHVFDLEYDDGYWTIEEIDYAVVYIGDGRYYGSEWVDEDDWLMNEPNKMCEITLFMGKISGNSCMPNRYK